MYWHAWLFYVGLENHTDSHSYKASTVLTAISPALQRPFLWNGIKVAFRGPLWELNGDQDLPASISEMMLDSSYALGQHLYFLDRYKGDGKSNL